MPVWKPEPPKNDAEYLERMSRAIFQAGLNWRMIENKWPNFRRSFAGFSPDKVAEFGEARVKALMKEDGIVHNEKKIRATILNAKEVLLVEKENASFAKYVDSFGADHEKLLDDLQERFNYLGPSSARVFLMMCGVKLRPTREEIKWHSKSGNKM